MIIRRHALDFQWPVQEPFLFCVHHQDYYPKAAEGFGPDRRLLSGRDIGQDFQAKDGFRMYHGETVPGFPVHPHRGFETITIVRRGYIDHADSLGAAGRYGEGDVQWMTAGSGVQHSEMFPLLHSEKENPVELFQIWLNLPRANKMVPAHFKMFWSEKIPRVELPDREGSVTVIAGEYGGKKALTPPPHSWASDSKNAVTILLVKLEKGGKFQLPKTETPVNRSVFFFEGETCDLNGVKLSSQCGYDLISTETGVIHASTSPAQFLILQAKPIGEPIVQHGPFVMNTKEEIVKTFEDFRKTEFGGWPWPRHDMVHGSVIERFAKFPDGKIEKPV